MEYLEFVIVNLLAAVVALGMAYALLPGRSRPQIVFATLAGYPLVIILTLLLLGATGYLRPTGLLFVLAPLALAMSLWILKQHAFSQHSNSPRLGEDAAARLAIPVCLLAGFASVIVLKVCLSGTQFFADDLGYHAPKVASWIQEEKFTFATRNMTAYYPANTELISLWYALPLHHDAWAGLAGLLGLILAAVSAVVLCREQGQSLATGILIAVLAVCSPGVFWQVRTFSATDLTGAAFALTGIYFAGLAARRISIGSGIAESLYAGFLLGAAIGSKITFVPVLLVVLVSLFFAGGSIISAPLNLKCILIFCLATLATGSYWYIQNWIATGNPLFPAQFGPFAGPWTKDQQSTEKLITLVSNRELLPQWLAIIKKDFDWPISLALISLCGYLAAIFREFPFARNTTHANVALGRMLLLSGLALLATYPFIPFSGNEYSWRYLTAPFLIGLVLFGSLIDERSKCHWFWTAVALLSIVTCWPGSGNNILVAMAGGVLGLGLVYLVARVALNLSAAMIVVSAFVVMAVCFGSLAALTNHQFGATADNLQQHGSFDKPIGLAWNALEVAPAGSRIAWWMNKNYEFLPLFGRKYQFQPVAVEPDGIASVPLHKRIPLDPDDKPSQSKSSRTYESAELINNLTQAGINFVLISKWPGKFWPAQYSALSKSDKLKVFYQDDYSVVWELKPPK